MMTFKEFLKTQEASLKAEAEALNRRRKQWETAILELMATIKSWLAESDPEGLLSIKDTITTHYDGLIDQSPLISIDIWMGSKVVTIRPTARNVLGPRLKPEGGEWSGRIDMIGHPYSYEIWLFVNTKDEITWHIRKERDSTYRLMTKESFENALVELFS